jgi:hypothetical protein
MVSDRTRVRHGIDTVSTPVSTPVTSAFIFYFYIMTHRPHVVSDRPQVSPDTGVSRHMTSSYIFYFYIMTHRPMWGRSEPCTAVGPTPASLALINDLGGDPVIIWTASLFILAYDLTFTIITSNSNTNTNSINTSPFPKSPFQSLSTPCIIALNPHSISLIYLYYCL